MLRKAVTLMALAFAALPGSALGAEALLVDDLGGPCTPSVACVLEYRATAGEANDVTATKVGDTVTIVDSGATITAGAGCTSVTPQEVVCSPAAGAFLDLRDLDDGAVIASGGNWAVNAGAGDDRIALCASCRAFYLAGSVGNDAMRGGGGDDDLSGGDGDDTLVGGIGRDWISPGEGDDAVAAGSGRDTVSYEATSVRHAVHADLRTGLVTGPGNDTLTGVEDFVGTRYADRITGNAAGNVIDGRAGEDLLVGKRGADVLVGGPQADRLLGQADMDRLDGEGGADLLVGGLGRDTLLGGDGADTLLARDGFRDVLGGQRGDDRARIDPRLDRATGIEIVL